MIFASWLKSVQGIFQNCSSCMCKPTYLSAPFPRLYQPIPKQVKPNLYGKTVTKVLCKMTKNRDWNMSSENTTGAIVIYMYLDVNIQIISELISGEKWLDSWPKHSLSYLVQISLPVARTTYYRALTWCKWPWLYWTTNRPLVASRVFVYTVLYCIAVYCITEYFVQDCYLVCGN